MPENTESQRRALVQWTAGIKYRQIRCAESLQPASRLNGRRLRGVTLTQDLCLGRDKEFYRIKDGIAWRLDPTDVLSEFKVSAIRALFHRALQERTRKCVAS